MPLSHSGGHTHIQASLQHVLERFAGAVAIELWLGIPFAAKPFAPHPVGQPVWVQEVRAEGAEHPTLSLAADTGTQVTGNIKLLGEGRFVWLNADCLNNELRSIKE